MAGSEFESELQAKLDLLEKKVRELISEVRQLRLERDGLEKELGIRDRDRADIAGKIERIIAQIDTLAADQAGISS
ncbi:hypothetical protein JXA80_09705 [bacterium]|nr:hypothetical protein [candidate division CSSED10-310 bacterium]